MHTQSLPRTYSGVWSLLWSFTAVLAAACALSASASAPAPGATSSRQVSAACPAPVRAKPAKVELEIEEGADLVAAWDKYFAANEPEPIAVVNAVSALRDSRPARFDHIIALIQAALRNGQAQPWMYEVLAVTMQAAERPKAEIERAVMSAADFANGPADLMYLGAYLARAGFEPRALKIFKRVAQMEPLWPEPYIQGLKIAQKLHDFEGIQWTTAGILSQAWPRAQADLWKTALSASKATLDDLRAKKLTDEAGRFEASLNAAVARDCAVVVSWTGDADVDVMVKEPTNSICSLQNWRTTSGGMMQGDRAAADGSTALQGHSVVYVCPKGFSGTYQLLVRRVWGDLTTGKVTVEVITHCRTSRAVRVCQNIALDDGQAQVKFNLTDGRRTEPVHEQQLANAVAAQVALTRQQQVLAQQIAAMNDPRAQQRLGQARAAAVAVPAAGAPGAVQQVPTPYFPIPFRGAVGYQPVIITLPEGSNFSATGVVSADRRYVRITCTPVFSGIAKVTTFNTASGDQTQQSGGGTNGQGYSGLFGPGGGQQGM